MDDPYEKVKMIWDFRGPGADQTAQHHCIHLNDYIRLEKLENCHVGQQKVSPSYSMAFMIVSKNLVPDLRVRLKPHRGQIYREG